MKKFFRDSCINNAGGLSAFVLLCIYLFIIWRLISSGSLIIQILAVLMVLYFVCSSIAGAVIIVVDLVRRFLARRKKSAPTEVSAE